MLDTSAVNNSGVANLLYGILAAIGLNFFTTVGLVFKGSKIYTRLIDRVDEMYQGWCEQHDIPFKPINNGRH